MQLKEVWRHYQVLLPLCNSEEIDSSQTYPAARWTKKRHHHHSLRPLPHQLNLDGSAHWLPQRDSLRCLLNANFRPIIYKVPQAYRPADHQMPVKQDRISLPKHRVLLSTIRDWNLRLLSQLPGSAHVGGREQPISILYEIAKRGSKGVESATEWQGIPLNIAQQQIREQILLQIRGGLLCDCWEAFIPATLLFCGSGKLRGIIQLSDKGGLIKIQPKL